MKKTINASILGIGTEITGGQILNSNAQWISQKLKALGVETLFHVTVPDERKLISEALQYIENTDLIFVTGGLGPTTDDFTRDVIATWSNKKMVWDQNSYASIEKRFAERGIPLRDAQKQQCYYPEGAKILTNSAGTANGFYLEVHNKKVFVLPGPPKEIAAIWTDHIQSLLKEFTLGINALKTVSWDCFGPGESEVSHLVEGATIDCPFEKGYRVHVPYVEVKLSYFADQKEAAKKWIDSIDAVLNPFTVARNGEDLAQIVCSGLSVYKKIGICDDLLQSYLLKRILQFGRPLFDENKLVFVNHPKDMPEDCDLKIEILKSHDHQIHLKINSLEPIVMISPRWLHALEDREKFYFTESVLIALSKAAELNR